MEKKPKQFDDKIMISLSSEDKCKIYEISMEEDRTMASVIRKFIKKGLSEYGR